MKQCIFHVLNYVVKSSSSVTNLIFEILVLEEKLASPSKQSFYFRKGIKNHIEKLKQLNNLYNRKRTFFNSHSLQVFIEERAFHLEFSRDILPKTFPYFIRAMHKADVENKIRELSDLIELKSFTKKLPLIKDWINYPNLLQTIIIS